jgi:hypothetical protein
MIKVLRMPVQHVRELVQYLGQTQPHGPMHVHQVSHLSLCPNPPKECTDPPVEAPLSGANPINVHIDAIAV